MTGVLRSDFGALAKLAAIPAAVTFVQLLAGDSPLIEFGFGLLLLLAISLAFGAGWFTVVRRANGEFAPWTAAVRFGLRGLPRLIGWTLVAVWLITLMVMVPLLPGFGSESGPLVTGGIVLAAVLAMGVGGSIYTALVGVVLVEGQGLGRALALLRTGWLATCVRMLVLGGTYWAYTHGSQWLVARVVDAGGPGWLASLVAAVLTVPAVVFQIVVMVVTYAELRGRADGTGTGGLAAGLAGRRWTVGAAGSSGAPMGTVVVAGRRRRGLRWVTPVLVLAVLLGAGGPWWPGAGSPVVPVAAVSPVAVVSPVPANPDGGPGGGDSGGESGGDSTNDAGMSVKGSSDSGKDGGGNSGSGAPARAEKSKPDSGADDDAGRESASTVSPQRGADSATSGDSQAREAAGSRSAEDGEQEGQADTAVARPAPESREQSGQADSAVAANPPAKGTEQDGRVRVAPPSMTDPENQNVAATPRRPGDPVQLTESASTSRTPAELPPGAVAAAPGSQPVPGTERVMIDGQPVDMSTKMMDFDTEGSTAANVRIDGRKKTLVGTCVQGSHSCTAHAIDGTNRSFPFYRENVTDSARQAMDGLATRSWQNQSNPKVSVAPTPEEFAQIRDESMAQRAVNDRNNERVNEVLGSLPGIGGPMRGARLGARALRELVPSRPPAGAGKLPEAGAAGREKLAQAQTQPVNPCLNSFTATTLVLMADGTRKPIKDVDRGNTVLATDPVTGQRGPREVVNLIRHGGPHTMVAVQLSGAGQIDATDRHPFWVASRSKWVDAIDLTPGDVVVSDRGDQIKVTNLEVSRQDLTAYNLTVAGLHTYYVVPRSSDGKATGTAVLVHNAGGCWGPDDLSASGARPSKGGYTHAGREYQKHTDDLKLPKVSGDKLDSAGQDLLDDILTAPGGRIESITGGQFKGGRYYIRQDGIGAAFDSNGVFRYYGRFR